jgi:predicted RNA-binding Zn ribbon-like protein
MNSTNTCSGALFLADNLALDFINSEYGMGDQHHDCLADDQSVMGWLQTTGLLPEGVDLKSPPGLLPLARMLRGSAKAVVNAAMHGGTVDPSVINQLLEAGRPAQRLEWNQDAGEFRIVTEPRDNRPASLLWPVADALVSLVTNDKFEFVRQCEAHDCVLLFHDLSKSHRRRWCSMATCGNRMKVAAFRSRKKPE